MTVFLQTVSQSQPFLLEVAFVRSLVASMRLIQHGFFFFFLTSRTYTEGLEQRKQREDMDWFQIKSSTIYLAHSNAELEPAW